MSNPTSDGNLFGTEKEKELLLTLKILVEGNEELINSKIDLSDQFLLAFLRGRRYDIMDTYKTCRFFTTPGSDKGPTEVYGNNLERYIDVRSRKYVEFFRDINISSLKYMEDIPRFVGLLKHRDPNGSRVYVLRPPLDLSQFRCMEDLIRLMVLELEQRMWDDDATKNGVVAVVDWTNFGFFHLKEITPSRLKMSSDIFLNAIPLVLKKVHCVNTSIMTSLAITIASPFISDRLRNRIIFHKDISFLHESIPQDILPNWLGGHDDNEDNVFEYINEDTYNLAMQKANRQTK